MKRSSQTTKVEPAEPDQLRVTALGVGHGDSLLIQWRNDGKVWTCLVDGGPSPDGLNRRLDAVEVGEIDLLVLTHLDTDHIGGLQGIAGKRRIASFWGPALPAFERHLWLFRDLGVAAIQRGRHLEDSLREAGVDVCYPLESYVSNPFNGGGSVAVLSPPARLIRRLLTEDDVLPLFSQAPMPLGWLVGAPQEPPQEQTPFMVNLDAALSRGFLEGPDLAGLPAVRRRPSLEPKQLAAEWSAQTGLEPEFFGDSVLNNTSLVLYLDVRTGHRLHRLLLPGDQENWTYLFARNPRGLQADVLKASHHGGRVYLEADAAQDELFSTVQPQVVLFSANGQHGLPRAATRQTAIRWGASVVCTCSRRAEFFSGELADDICCHAHHSCGEANDVSLLLDSSGIRSELPACHSGLGRQLGPVIQVRQHVVDPSPVVSHLAEHELRRHIEWVKSKLDIIRENRARLIPDLTEGSQAVSEADLAELAREEGRLPLVPHLGEVLHHGMSRGAFWAAPKERYDRNPNLAYAMPTVSEVKRFLEKLGDKAMILFPRPVKETATDQDSLVNGLELEGLASYADGMLHLPAVAFRDSLWPSVAREFKCRNWHCFVHRSKMVAFSTHSTGDGLFQALVRAFLRQDGRNGEWQFRVNTDEFPFSSAVLVSATKEEGKPFDQYGLRDQVDRWLEVREEGCPEWHWRKLVDEGLAARGSSYLRNRLLEGGRLANHAKGDVSRIAEFLVPLVERLW